MSQKVKCPHCSGSCSVEEKYLGKKMQCPRCSKVFQAGNEPPPPPPRTSEPLRDSAEIEDARSARIAGSRRRRRFATVNALLLTLAAGGALAAVAWHAHRTGILKKFGPAPAGPPAEKRDMGTGRGFHILSDSYWSVFDDLSLIAKPVVVQPAKQPDAAARIDSEGLELHEMKVTGPWYLVNDMGGLVPSAVGVWVSPNQLGQGKEAFYVEPGEEVTVSHWAKNFGGFKVFRVVNIKRRPGPGSKVHEAGWIIGLYLRDSEGNPIK